LPVHVQNLKFIHFTFYTFHYRPVIYIEENEALLISLTALFWEIRLKTKSAL
jgi:hypothetical protein